MAGKITVSTINDSSGVLATQNGMTGIAKAWVNFNGTGTPAINGSFNVSSITRTATGRYTVSFTTAMTNANYVPAGSCQNNLGGCSNVIFGSNSGASVLTTSGFEVANYNTGGSTFDTTVATVVVFGA